MERSMTGSEQNKLQMMVDVFMTLTETQQEKFLRLASDMALIEQYRKEVSENDTDHR